MYETLNENKMKTKPKQHTSRVLMFLLLALCTISLSAQKVVKGTVSDINGIPIIGANVIVKETTIGTVTDIDGAYTLEVPGDNSIIVFSYIGYNSSETIVG